MNRAIQNDRSTRIEVCGAGLYREEHRGQIGSDDFFKRSERCITDRRRAWYPGIREHDIEFAELSYGCGNGALEISDFRHVRLYRQHSSSKFLVCRIQGLRVPPGDRHLGALRQK